MSETAAQTARNIGLERAGEHHEASVEMVIEVLAKCRLNRLSSPSRNQKWTVEQLIGLAEKILNGSAWKRGYHIEIPSKINGNIGVALRKRGIIVETGELGNATRECRHFNKVPLVMFCPEKETA